MSGLGGRIVHRQHSVGDPLRRVGDGCEHDATQDGKRQQAESAPENLPEEMERERQQAIWAT
jgi:hypothetical protein